MLVTLDAISYSYAHQPILREVSLALAAGDRLGLIGRNGTGKTTLLKVLAGELDPDLGQVHRSRATRAAFLRQTQDMATGTVLDAALVPLADVVELEGRIAALTAAMAQSGESGARVEEYGQLQDLFERRGGYGAVPRAKKVLSGLGFAGADLDKPASALSGGEKNRLALTQLLLSDAKLLLLDEPTNHLDLEATEFLEDFLAADRTGQERAVALVSHDRRFLDRVANRTALLEDARIRLYPGGYTRALALREEEREVERKTYAQQQAHIACTEEFIRRNIAGQKTKQAQSRRTQLAKLERVERPQDSDEAARIQLQAAPPSEREVLAAQGLCASLGGRTLFQGASFVLQRGERVGLVGPNGSGKTTLLKVLLGLHPPDAGSVRMGGQVRVGYYDQALATLDPRQTVLESLRSARASTSDEHLRGWAGRFLFSGDEALRPIHTLSGGEKARAALARLTLSGFNLLVLDEPTNHLDATSREALEGALAGYDGTLLCVSHDRHFLDQVASRILWIDRARIEDWPGRFSEVRQKRRAARVELRDASGPTEAQRSYEESRARERERRSRLRRAQAIDAELHALEASVEALAASLADPAKADAWEELARLHREKDAAEERMLALMQEREILESP